MSLGEWGMRFDLLGPLHVSRNGAELAVRGGKPRMLLVALLLDAGKPVPAERLAAALWDGPAPVTAKASLHNHVRALRCALGDTDRRLVKTAVSGYSIDVLPGLLDVQVFEDLRRRGRAAQLAGDWALASAELTEALKLWRGEPLPDLQASALVADTTARWAEQRLQALEWRIDSDLHRGNHDDAVAELSALVAANPLRENLAALLMMAFHRAGRQAEALAVYRRTRDVLVEELGVEPGRHIRQLHQRILADDPALLAAAPAGPAPPPSPHVDARPPRTGPARADPPVPRQLPPAVRHFAGRAEELKTLADLVEATTAPGGTAVVAAIDGTAGVGKTALALYWAHQVAERFPEGQLYANLRGFDPAGPPLPPGEAIRGFLIALGVPAPQIPASLDARTVLYRSVLAGKRVLLVLDNARDAEQVRPLLPGSAGCLVVATSRAQLLSLVAADGAYPITLDLLTLAESRELLDRRLGAERVSREEEAADELIGLCAGLPLALNIVAARAASQPGRPLAGLVRQLRDARSRLDLLNAGDHVTDVRAVFSWSYQRLGGLAARMFRLLGGAHPGPDISAPAAASLAAVPLGQARPVLTELVEARLLIEHPAGRFFLHDLLHEYAAEQAQALDGADERTAARRRVLSHYLHTVCRADRLLAPTRDPVVPAEPEPGTAPEDLADGAQAVAWLDAEYPVLLAAIRAAAGSDLDTYTWQLAWAVSDYLALRGHWQAYVATQDAALAAVMRLADGSAEARIRTELGYAHGMLGGYAEADRHLRHALHFYRQAGDRVNEAIVTVSLAHLLGWQERNAEARDQALRALELAQAEGHLAAQASALNTVGWYSALLGDHHAALTCCRQALALLQDLGNRHGQAAVLDSLGYIHRHLGDTREALSCYREALRLFRDLGDWYKQSEALTGLGDTYHAAGDAEAARDCWKQALGILTGLGHPDADDLRSRLKDQAS